MEVEVIADSAIFSGPGGQFVSSNWMPIVAQGMEGFGRNGPLKPQSVGSEATPPADDFIAGVVVLSSQPLAEVAFGPVRERCWLMRSILNATQARIESQLI